MWHLNVGTSYHDNATYSALALHKLTCSFPSSKAWWWHFWVGVLWCTPQRRLGQILNQCEHIPSCFPEGWCQCADKCLKRYTLYTWILREWKYLQGIQNVRREPHIPRPWHAIFFIKFLDLIPTKAPNNTVLINLLSTYLVRRNT